jgi:hypothetical protein
MDRDDQVALELISEFNQQRTWRTTFENHWEEVATLIMPSARNTFTFENFNIPGEKKTQEQIDSTAALALRKFGSITDSLLSPRNTIWHQLTVDNPDLNKVRDVKLWFEEATRRLFKARYATTANFSGQNQQVYKNMGAFGTGPLFIDRLDGKRGERGFRYKALPLGECYLGENHQGVVNRLTRAFPMTVRQYVEKFPNMITKTVQSKMDAKKWDDMVKILHVIKPRTDFDPERLDEKGKEFGSWHVILDDKKVIQEGGFSTFPAPTARFDVAANEIYGRGPAMQVLPAMKTLNAQKRIVLKQGHRTVDPVLLSHDNGIAGFSMKPGALNPGNVNKDGRSLVQPLPIGRVDIGKDLMDDEREVINDAFFVTLFQILTETPQMTATEVLERVNEKGMLLAPTIGQQQDEYQGPAIERELDLMVDMQMLPPMPQELVEAEGEFKIVYTSPLAKAQRAQESAGLFRTLEQVINIATATGNPEPLDHYDWDVIVPEINDNASVPTRWMLDEEAIAAIRQGRAQEAEDQKQIQAAPSAAAMIKAQKA